MGAVVTEQVPINTNFLSYGKVQACINAPATPLASVLQVQISGSSSVGAQVDEVSKALVLESAEAEPELSVECRPGGFCSKRPASSERVERKYSVPQSALSAPAEGERHSVHPTSAAEEEEEETEEEPRRRRRWRWKRHRRKTWKDEI